MPDPIVRDLLEILEDRYDKQATLITSQLPIEQWHDYLGNKTVADAFLDRLVHNAHKLNLKANPCAKQKRLRKRRQLLQMPPNQALKLPPRLTNINI